MFDKVPLMAAFIDQVEFKHPKSTYQMEKVRS